MVEHSRQPKVRPEEEPGMRTGYRVCLGGALESRWRIEIFCCGFSVFLDVVEREEEENDSIPGMYGSVVRYN